MKVKMWCDSGANAQSCREEIIDTLEMGISDEAWRGLSEDEKQLVAEEWANDCLEIGFEEMGNADN